jgi:amino-acid N-acetyltransferase
VLDLMIREATPDDAAAIAALIRDHQVEGHLLPRSRDEIRGHAPRFVVVESASHVVACAELAPLSRQVAEIRSLVVAEGLRRSGLASRLVNQLRSRARAGRFTTLVAFTHDPRVFIRENFSIVPHLWVPEKLTHDCGSCALFRRCGQFAMVQTLTEIPRVGVITPVRRVAVA